MALINRKKSVEQVEKEQSAAIAKKDWQTYLVEAKGLERDYLAELIKSRKNARIFGAIGLTFGALMAFWHQFNPVTITEPYIFRVDKTTGAVEHVTTVKDQTLSQGEVVDRYWIGNYVRHYENYAYQSIQFDYDNTLAMSSRDVATAYMEIYSSENGKIGRDKELGMNRVRQVKIISITPDSKIDGLATVRFQTFTTGDTAPVNWIATITYEYVKDKMSDEQRMLNPLGFIVTSYRVEREIL